MIIVRAKCCDRQGYRWASNGQGARGVVRSDRDKSAENKHRVNNNTFNIDDIVAYAKALYSDGVPLTISGGLLLLDIII